MIVSFHDVSFWADIRWSRKRCKRAILLEMGPLGKFQFTMADSSQWDIECVQKAMSDGPVRPFEPHLMKIDRTLSRNMQP